MNEPDERTWSGGERRRGRTVYSRGPIILGLELLSGLGGLVAIAALVISLVIFSDKLSLIQQSRQRSAVDTCYLFRSVVLKASFARHRTAAGEAFLTSVGLHDCQAFGANITKINK